MSELKHDSEFDILPPDEIMESAIKVCEWMERNNRRDWQLGGLCDRRMIDRLNDEIDRLKKELIIAYTPESRDDHDL